MTSPPVNRAPELTEGRFFSPYPHYYNFSNDDTIQIEQGSQLQPPTNTAHVYHHQTNLVDVGVQFVPAEAVKAANDFVPLGAQVAWDQGATHSHGVDDSMGMTSPLSQCVPVPLMPGISSFGPILNTWPVPSPQRRRPSAGKPTLEQQQQLPSRRRKFSTTAGQKKKDERNKRKTTSSTTTATDLPQITPENSTTSPPSGDSIVTMSDSPGGQPSVPPGFLHEADHGHDESMNGYPNQTTQTPPSPPPPAIPQGEAPTGMDLGMGDGGVVHLATQRARNRVAANKFRKKSKAAVAELEAVERALGARHEQLSMMVRDLREEVLGLKNELLMHGNCGCAMIHQYLSNTARSLSLGNTSGNGGGGGGLHNTTNNNNNNKNKKNNNNNNNIGHGTLPSLTPSPDDAASLRRCY